MATQDDIYRESQKTAAEAAKTTEELQKVVQALAEARNNPTQDPEALKLLEEQRDAANAAAEAADEANERAKKREEIERKLRGQSEKQYDAMLKQRKVAEDAKKEMDEIASILGDDAKNNKQYQDAQKKYNKEQAKAEKLKGRRNLLSRFKDVPGKAGAAIAGGVKGAKDAGMAGLSKTFEGIGKLVKKFTGIFAIMIMPALMLLVNSPIFPMLKDAISKFIDFFFESILPVLVKAKDEIMPIFKDLYDKVLLPIYNWFLNFMSKEGGGIDILLNYVSAQWENVKKLFQSMIDLFDNLMKGDFEAAFGNLGDIGKTLMSAIDEALTAILKLGLAAFGLSFDGSIGDLISNWLTTTWESIKAVLRKIPGLGSVEALQAGSASQRAKTVAAKEDIGKAESQAKSAKRGMGRAGKEEKFSGRLVKKRRAKLAELEKEAEEKGGFDKLEQSKTVGLDKNDIIKARKALQAAEERERKAVAKTLALNQQLADAETKKAEAQKRLANVKGDVASDAEKNRKAGQLKKLPPSEAEKAEQVNKAANDNKNAPPIAIGGPTNVSTTNPTKTSVAGPISTSPHPNSATGVLARGGGSMAGGPHL